MIRKKKKRTVKILGWIVLVYVIFFAYNNLDFSKSRTYEFYNNFSIGNETFQYNSSVVSGAQPIFLPRGEKAIILLPGMGGTPIELKEMANYLADRNITVIVPLLPFQGRTYKDIKNLNNQIVYDDVLKYVNVAKLNYKKVYVGGLSYGGSLSLKLAESQEVDGIISLATPMTYGFNWVGDITFYLFNTLQYITPNMRRVVWGLARNSSIEDELPSFDRTPIRVLLQGELIKKEIKANLNKINEPILILQSSFDNRAAPSSAKYIYDNVNSSIKKLVYLNNSGHDITMDYDKEIVFEEAYKFIINN